MKSGFTLIELLVVISIIGILSALLLANMVGIRERGRDSALKNDLKQFKTALRMYYNDNQAYPPGDDVACETLADDSGVFGNGAGTIYMRDIQRFADFDCTYTRTGNGEGFQLRANLLNSGDKDIAASATRCGATAVPGENYYYECAD